MLNKKKTQASQKSRSQKYVYMKSSFNNRDSTNNFPQKDSVIWFAPQPAFACSKLTIDALEQEVKYVQN